MGSKGFSYRVVLAERPGAVSREEVEKALKEEVGHEACLVSFEVEDIRLYQEILLTSKTAMAPMASVKLRYDLPGSNEDETPP